MIIDSHCHLDLLEQKGFDIDEIIKNANSNNVKILQTICTFPSKISEILKFCDKYDNVYGSVGLHPCNVESEETTAEKLIEICKKNPKIIGIGETGLDYFHKPFDAEKQKKSFLEHIKASQELDIPVIIHSRNADDDMIEILENEQKKKKFPAILHCFSSSKKLALKAVELGIYISISGIITFKNATDLQNIVKNLPIETLFTETDSPYLAPMPHRGETNQPAYTKHIVEFIAELKNLSAEKVAQITSKNFLNCHFQAKISCERFSSLDLY